MAAKSRTTRLAFPYLEGKDAGAARREGEEMRETRMAEGVTKRRSDRLLAHDIDQVPNTTLALFVLAKLAALAVVGLGSVVLLGWLFGIEPLKRVLPGLESMKPTTAVTFVLSGILLFLRSPGVRNTSDRRLRSVLSLLIIAIGALTLIGFAFVGDFNIAQLSNSDGWSAEATRPMSVVTALEFTLFGAAMLLSRSHGHATSFVALTFLGMLVSLLAIVGYLYDLPILYAPLPGSSIALHTAVAFFVLFVGAAMTRPDTGWVTLLASDSVTGAFAPWLLPALVVLPIALGWVLDQAITGSIITAELGVDLFALASVLFLIVVAWRTGVIANRLGRNLELREQLDTRLQEARVAAEEANIAKSDFLANMTHELRTPLNSIIGFAGLLAKSRGLGAKDRRYVEIIDGSSQSLLALVNDVLDVSSLDAGGVTLHPSPFSLPKLVEGVAASFSLIAREKGLTLKVERGDVVAAAHFGDELRIRQVLVNLVNNAVKFTSKGGVTVALSAEERSDSVQRLRIEVRDTGIGIAPSKLAALFGRFSQADSSIHNRFGGTGLGLAISRRLVELMGGNIGVESVEGKGTTLWLTLTLPCGESSALVEKEATTGPRSRAHGRHILVVDDVDLNRELVTALLAPHGHTVHQAADGAEAVTAVASTDYDLVLMDVQMPGMDGLTATRAIRAIDRFAKLPIVAMTAQARPSQIAMCKEAGMDDYLAKPITPAALFAVIDKWALGAPSCREAAPETNQSTTGLRDEFLVQCAKDLARVKSLLASGSPSAQQALKRLAHHMAGTAGMLGLGDVSVYAAELDEALGRESGPNQAEYAQLMATLEQLVKAA